MFNKLRLKRKQRRDKLLKDIAEQVVLALQSSRGWKKFLPPVTLHDSVYMVTEGGTIYELKKNHLTESHDYVEIARII